MCHSDACLGHQLLQPRGDGVDGLHAIVDIEDLPAAFEFAEDGAARHVGVVGTDVRGDGQPLLRRRFDDADVARAGQRHIERARDGRRGQRKHVYFCAHLLQAFFVPDAEALFLIDNNQPQVFEGDVFLQQAMRANDDVNLARLQSYQDFVLLRVGAKARQ